MILYFYSLFILFSICYGILFMLQLYFKGPKDPNSPVLKWAFACMHVQSCLTLCNPMDCSPPSSSVHGIFPGQEYSRGLPCPPPGYLPDPEIERGCPPLPADSLPSELLGKPWNIYMYLCVCIYFFFLRSCFRLNGVIPRNHMLILILRASEGDGTWRWGFKEVMKVRWGH